MATFVGDIKDRQIILVAAVSVPGYEENQIRCNALMDTGAQVTMISKKVIDEVGLQAIGHMSIVPVTGAPSRTKKYRARIDIPIDGYSVLQGGAILQHSVLGGMDLQVGELPYEPANHAVLLGMDFLSSFHITMYGNNYILSN